MNKNIDINTIIEDFAKDFLKILIGYMTVSNGKRKGLSKNSKLIQTANASIKDGDISIFLEEYFKYFDSGRRANAKKVPILVLIKWIKEKNIRPKGQTINQLAFAIQTSIAKKGIKPRNIIERSLRDLDKLYINNTTPKLEMIIDTLIESVDFKNVKESKVNLKLKNKTNIKL